MSALGGLLGEPEHVMARILDLKGDAHSLGGSRPSWEG